MIVGSTIVLVMLASAGATPAGAQGVDWPEAGQTVKGLGHDGSPPARHPDASSPLIALTFDDGPHPTRTPAVLDILKRNRIRATFFVVGSSAQRYPDLIRRMAAEGHTVAAHTMNHPNLTTMSAGGQSAEIRGSADVLDSILGAGSTQCMRPPYGAYNATTVDVARDRGLGIVLWSRETGDTRGASHGQMVANAMSTSLDGGRGIVLMHDTKSATVSALPDIISAYQARGYRFATLCGDGRAPDIAQSDLRYVRASFRLFLGREASADELVERGSRLYYGYGRADLAVALVRSPEWVSRAVDQVYRQTIGRPGDAGGRAYWTDVVRRGTRITDLGAYMLASDEFYSQSGRDADGFVQRLYQRVLGRSADPSGLAYWRDVLARGASRYDVAQAFYASVESRRTRVRGTFAAVLGRSPDPGGHAYWAGQLLVMDDVSLASFLAQSDEFYARAQRTGA